MLEGAPIFFSFMMSLLVSLILLGLSFPFASNSSTYPEKLSAYECGFDPLTLYILLLILFANAIPGIFNMLWFKGEVAAALIIAGGSSAIFFLFLATNDDEKRLSLLFFVVNNVTLLWIYIHPNICCFLLLLFIALLTVAHLSLWLRVNFLYDLIFFSILLARIFFDHQMAPWGFGLVSELLFLNLFFFFFRKKGYEIGTISYLIPLFLYDLIYLIFSLNYDLKEILIHINFLGAAAALIYFSFCSQNKKDLALSFLFYFFFNITLGLFLAKGLFSFLIITLAFLLSSLFFASLFFIKALRDKRPFSGLVLANKGEGVHALLVVFFLVLGVLLSQLNINSATLSLYSGWLVGLGLQLGFLTAINYFFKK